MGVESVSNRPKKSWEVLQVRRYPGISGIINETLVGFRVGRDGSLQRRAIVHFEQNEAEGSMITWSPVDKVNIQFWCITLKKVSMCKNKV